MVLECLKTVAAVDRPNLVVDSSGQASVAGIDTEEEAVANQHICFLWEVRLSHEKLYSRMTNM